MKPQRTLRVMLVEDSTLLVRELSAALHELGPIEVQSVARSEDAARKALRADPRGFDVLVVDVFLAQGSGLGVVRAAKTLCPSAHVVILSNFATLDVRKRCVGLGADRVFDKSRQLGEFFDCIARLASDEPGREPLEADTLP